MELKDYIGEYLYKKQGFTEKTEFEIRETDPFCLLTPERLDIISKYLLLEYFDLKTKSVLPYIIYKEIIDIFSDGNFTEAGNEKKNDFESFISEFKETYNSIKENGFDESLSCIPIGTDNVILDGAHRTAIIMYLNLPVKTIFIPDASKPYFNYDYFRRKQLPENYIQILVRHYARLTKRNIYTICLWPSAAKHCNKNEIEKQIEEKARIIYFRSIKLTELGFKNFLINVYMGQPWLESAAQEYKGVYGKHVECYEKDLPTNVYLIEGPDLEEILQLKGHIRNLCNIGKHSVHITDTREEALSILDIITNNEAINMLNYGDFVGTVNRLEHEMFNKSEFVPPQYLGEIMDVKIEDSGCVKNCAEALDRIDNEYVANLFGYMFLTAKAGLLIDPANEKGYLAIRNKAGVGFFQRARIEKDKAVYNLKRFIKNSLRRLGVLDLVTKLFFSK